MFKMKAALFACVAGLLFTFVISVSVDTSPPQCGCNEEPTNCVPCDKICNRTGTGPCSRLCASTNRFCKCVPNTCRPTSTSDYCVIEVQSSPA